MSSPHSVYRTQVLATPAAHRLSVSQLFDVSWNYLLDNLSLAAAYGPAHHIGEYIVTSLLSRLRHGQLRIVTLSGKVLVFPPRDEVASSDKSRRTAIYCENDRSLTATLVVRRDSFWTRVVFGNLLGLSEAFMCGDVDCEDVSALIKLFVENRQYLSVQGKASRLLSIPKLVTQSRFLPTIGNAKANVSAHYDLGNVMFESFLSSEMVYSCPIYSYNQKAGETLETAQDRKMRRLVHKAQIRSGHRVLDLGCGWGSLSILIAQTYPSCHVDAVTLSVHQYTYAQRKIQEAGLADRVNVHLMDYREILSRPDWHRTFDRVISCEMVEAIGKDYVGNYWEVIDWVLNETDGVGVIQGITLPEARVEAYDLSIDFIRKWIFPGSYIPSLAFLISTLSTATCGRLTVDSVENIGPTNYSRALSEWRTRFLANFDSKIKPALQGVYQLGPEDLETFRRKWIWYFGYCEQGFRARMIGCHIITFAREGNPGFLSSP